MEGRGTVGWGAEGRREECESGYDADVVRVCSAAVRYRSRGKGEEKEKAR
jgi:hypothetical protein